MMSETPHPGPTGPLDIARAAILGGMRQLAVELRKAVRQHGLLLAIVLAYWAVGLVIARSVKLPADATIDTYLPVYLTLMPGVLVALVVGRCIAIVCMDRPARPLLHIGRDLRDTVFTLRRVVNALPMLGAILVFGGTFTLIKAAMPALNDYSWDAAFDTTDRWLHGGMAPWQLLQPWLGYPVVTHVINILYAIWFLVLGTVLVWQVFSLRDQRLRLQFFWTLLTTWIFLGNIAATFLASAGPCFYGRMTGMADPYEPLMAYLREVDVTHPIWALKAQELLWQHYLTRQVEIAAGISAMPSLHVAISTLLALLCWRTHKLLGLVMTLYAIAIMIGSVHLGWHYAIDGYFGAVGSIVIWWAVGLGLRRWGGEGDRSVALASSTPA